MSFFFLFSSTKLENRMAEQVLPKQRGVGTSGSGDVVGKGGRRVNTVQKIYIHVNAKMIPIEIIPGIGGRRR
jgi:hypothetical protein